MEVRGIGKMMLRGAVEKRIGGRETDILINSVSIAPTVRAVRVELRCYCPLDTRSVGEDRMSGFSLYSCPRRPVTPAQVDINYDRTSALLGRGKIYGLARLAQIQPMDFYLAL